MRTRRAMRVLAVVTCLLGTRSAAAATDPGCVLGPLEGDGGATLSDGTPVRFPMCWSGPGTLVQGSAPLQAIEDRVGPYGVHVLQKDGRATIAVAAFEYESSPIGPYREVFTMTYVTDRPGAHRLDLRTMASMASYLPFRHPSRRGAAFVLNSYIDASSAKLRDRAVRLNRELFGYGEPATVTFGDTPETFRVVHDGQTLFDVHLPEVARGPYMGLTHAYAFDFYLIGENLWSRQVTRGRMGQSTNFDGYRFAANPNDPASAPFARAAFTSPADASETSYLSFRHDAVELHTPIKK